MVEGPGTCHGPWSPILVAGDDYLERDSVFGVRDSLIREFADQPAGTSTPDGQVLAETWTRARFDIVLAPAGT